MSVYVTVTNISQSLLHIMAGKQLARYAIKKLRHCHPMYIHDHGGKPGIHHPDELKITFPK